MKTPILLSCSLAFVLAGSGDREDGLEHYRAGRYTEAVAAFQRAIAADEESAELHFNLALAAWRAGDLATAEVAVEKYAALFGNPRASLHAGLLGAVRFEQGKRLDAQADAALQAMQQPVDNERQPEDPLQLLGQALVKAQQAKGHFVRGATEERSPECVRNLERTLRFIQELEDKIEQLKQQQQDSGEDGEPQEKQDDESEKQDEQGDEQKEKQEQGEKGEQEQGEPKPDESEQQAGEQSEEQPSEESQQNQKQQGETPPEQEGEAEQPPEPQRAEPQEGEPQEGQPEGQNPQQPDPRETPEGSPSGEPEESKEPEQAEPQPSPAEPDGSEQPAEGRSDAPGEGVAGRALTPEQTQRLRDKLQQLEQQLQQLRQRSRSRRGRVERDW